jgi:hypothetical protein
LRKPTKAKPGDGGRKIRTARANAWAADLAPLIAQLRADGVTSKRGIAAALNEHNIPTARGRAHWLPGQVARLLARIDA